MRNLRISWGNHWNIEHISPMNGFGYVTERVVDSLRSLGHTVESNLDNADVEFWYDQPNWIRWHNPDAHKIAYVPWESTELQPGWAKRMNEADEVWATSPNSAEWFVSAGIKKPVKVYLHGVDKIWTPVQRVLDTNFNLFHHGGEAARKGWDLTAKMFFEGFPEPYQFMNFKMSLPGWEFPVPRVNVIKGQMPIDDLVKLYHEQHLMVYPSWGEGFGLTPLQAMATGMPVLITKGWAPYEHMLPQECLIESELVESPWQNIHPGKMFQPDYDDMFQKTKLIYEDYDYFSGYFMALSDTVRQDFDWVKLTRAAFSQENLIF